MLLPVTDHSRAPCKDVFPVGPWLPGRESVDSVWSRQDTPNTFRHPALCIQRWSEKDTEGGLGYHSVVGHVPSLCEVLDLTSAPENRSCRIPQDLAQPPRALSLHHAVSDVFRWFCLDEWVNRSCKFKFYFHLCVYESAYLSVYALCLDGCSWRPEDVRTPETRL